MRGDLLYSVRDVGPSAGYYGCLGFALANTSSRRATTVGGVALLLILRLASSGYHLPNAGHILAADLAHVVAFPIGALWGAMWKRRKVESTQVAGWTAESGQGDAVRPSNTTTGHPLE
jgi:hypothetical protein